MLFPAEATAGTQGLTVILHGGGFLAETAISLGGQTKSIDFINDTQLQIALTPADFMNAGALEIVASNPSPGGGFSNSMSFTVVNLPPVLTSLSPNSATAGSPGFTLSLTGSGFQRAAEVQFNNFLVSATWINSGRIEAAIPAGAIATGGSYPVVVINPAPGGGPSAALLFSVSSASKVAPLPDGAFGKPYEDFFPADATIPAYDPKRFSLITGLVKDLVGNSLAGVTVGIHGRPEYGTVQTGASGRFSLPLDGGGTVTLIYQKSGYLITHRQVEVPWNGIVTAETVLMVAEDSAATAVKFDGTQTTIFTHTSTTVKDARGPRALTLVFSGDNLAWVKDAHGNRISLTNITVRATEYVTT